MGDRIRNIRLIDSYLIASGAALVVFALFIAPWVTPKGVFLWNAVAAGLGLIFVGSRVRASEDRAIDLWKMLDAAREITVSDITLTTGMPRRRVLKDLILVNTLRGVDYVHVPERDLIVDRRLLRTLPIRKSCEGCGYNTSERVSLLLYDVPECPSCGSGLKTDLNEHKSALLDRLKAETAEYRDPSQFNGCLFLLMWIIPPFAIGYAGLSVMRYFERRRDQ